MQEIIDMARERNIAILATEYNVRSVWKVIQFGIARLCEECVMTDKNQIMKQNTLLRQEFYFGRRSLRADQEGIKAAGS